VRGQRFKRLDIAPARYMVVLETGEVGGVGNIVESKW
jgi:hypothetical protein